MIAPALVPQPPLPPLPAPSYSSRRSRRGPRASGTRVTPSMFAVRLLPYSARNIPRGLNIDSRVDDEFAFSLPLFYDHVCHVCETFCIPVERIYCTVVPFSSLRILLSRTYLFISIYLPVCASALSSPFPHFPSDPFASRSSIAIKYKKRAYWHLKRKTKVIMRKSKRERRRLSMFSMYG